MRRHHRSPPPASQTHVHLLRESLSREHWWNRSRLSAVCARAASRYEAHVGHLCLVALHPNREAHAPESWLLFGDAGGGGVHRHRNEDLCGISIDEFVTRRSDGARGLGLCLPHHVGETY